jgi:hypothetical protein
MNGSTLWEVENFLLGIEITGIDIDKKTKINANVQTLDSPI